MQIRGTTPWDPSVPLLAQGFFKQLIGSGAFDPGTKPTTLGLKTQDRPPTSTEPHPQPRGSPLLW